MVSVKLQFVTRMQKYSGQREIRMELPDDPRLALDAIFVRFDIPWKDDLEKSTRIFINKKLSNIFIKTGELLKEDDVIAFIPISGGG